MFLFEIETVILWNGYLHPVTEHLLINLENKCKTLSKTGCMTIFKNRFSFLGQSQPNGYIDILLGANPN